MKTFVTLALTMVLIAATLVGCGCTNRNMDNTSAPTVLPTNEEIWNSTESTTRFTTETTTATENTNGTAVTETSDSTENSTIENRVNASSDLTDKLLEMDKASKAAEGNTNSRTRQMVPGTR